MKDGYVFFNKAQTNIKSRWRNRHLIDILVSEYSRRNTQYYLDAIDAGCILINNKKTSHNYVMKEQDILMHVTHRHEPKQPRVIYKNQYVKDSDPLQLNTKENHTPKQIRKSEDVEILSIETDYVVVYKPPGLICHPNPNCHYYTLTKTLEPILGSLGCVNRLDAPTSGIVILSKNNRLHEIMKKKKIQKTYIALVSGKLEDQIVDKPIKIVYGKCSMVHADGKESQTKFKCLNYNGIYSLVECTPITGRTHQIRVHLQSIGHPIINDRLYDGEITEESQNECVGYCKGNNKESNMHENDIMEKLLTEEGKVFAYSHCEYKNNAVYINKDSHICLHAYKYQIDDKIYTAQLPSWALLDRE